MVIRVIVKSSSNKDTSYPVEFRYENQKLSVFCTCEAGVHRQFCKHKLGLLSGDHAILKDPSEAMKLSEIQELVRKTKYCEMLGELSECEKILQETKSKRDNIKKRLEEAMRYGVGG